MFDFGNKKKRARLIGISEIKEGVGLLAYVCPECNETVAALLPLNGHSISDLKRELEIECSSCGKEIILENYD